MKHRLNDKVSSALVYPANTTGRKNVLLIYNGVKNAQTFADSANDSTFPIIYSSTSKKTELLAVLRAQSATLDRIGIVFASDSGKIKSFLDGKSLFTATEPATSPYSENVEFIISLIKEFSVKNIDYLACNTLKYSNWTNYYSVLTRETGVIVGASNDKTGNIKYGGNWVMENTSQDIETIYFNKSIKYYSYLLDQPHTVWSSGVNSPTKMAISGNYMYAITHEGGTVSKISMFDGSIVDEYWGGLELNYARDLTISGDYMYLICWVDFGSGWQSVILKINMSDGTVVGSQWYVSTMSSAYSLCNDGNYVYVLFGEPIGIIIRIFIDDGTVTPSPLWTTTLPYPLSLTMSENGNYIYVSSDEGDIQRIDIATASPGAVWNTSYYDQIVTSGQYIYGLRTYSFPYFKIDLLSSADGSLIQSEWVNNLYFPGGIVISGQYLYVTMIDDGYILKLNLATPCFLEGTRILCKVDKMEVYLPIEELKPGILVKTALNGYKAVDSIGKREIQNPGNDERIQDRLYKYTKDKYPELMDDLFITGCHSILVDSVTDKQREDTVHVLGDVYVTDKKYRLMAFVDERAEPWDSEGTYTIWHFALENTDYYMNYGVYANGLLVESSSLRYMKELSGMKLL